MDDLIYEILAWLAGGHSVFRPREATEEAEEAFRPVVAVLARLRDRAGWTTWRGMSPRPRAGST